MVTFLLTNTCIWTYHKVIKIVKNKKIYFDKWEMYVYEYSTMKNFLKGKKIRKKENCYG